MKMKKMLAAGLAGVMAVSILGGRGSSTQTTGTQTATDSSAQTDNIGGESSRKAMIRFWEHRNEAWQITYEDMIAKFEGAYPEYDVQSEYYPCNSFQIRIRASLMTKGGGANVYAMWGGWALDFGSTGTLAEVPEDTTENLEDDFYQPAVAAYEYGGKYYGVPMEYNLEYSGILINKKLFDEVGYTYPITWEELEKVSDQAFKSNGNAMEMREFDFVSGDSLPYQWLKMILSSGGQYFNEDGTMDFNTDIAISTMEQSRSYVVNRKWTNLDSLTQGTSAYRLLYEGRSFIHSVGCWSVSNGEAAYGLKYSEDYDYVTLPSYSTKIAFIAETGWGLAVPEASKRKEDAWKFVEFFTALENLINFNMACAQIPPCKSMPGNETYLKSTPYAECLLEVLDRGQWIGPYNTETFKGGVNSMFVTLCSTNEYTSVEETLPKLTDTVNQTKIS